MRWKRVAAFSVYGHYDTNDSIRRKARQSATPCRKGDLDVSHAALPPLAICGHCVPRSVSGVDPKSAIKRRRGSVPITTLVIFTFVLVLLNSAAIAYAAIWQRRWAIDPQRIGGAIAARLLDNYAGETETLSEYGVKKHARDRYLELCGATGLPETAVNRVVDVVWGIVSKAQGGQNDAVAIYE